MPKETPTWDKLKRSLGYIQAFTIGYAPIAANGHNMGGGRIYHQKVHELYKKADLDYARKYNKQFSDYWDFMEKWISLGGDKVPEHQQIVSMLTGYFSEHPKREAAVNIVLSKRKAPKRVEIRGMHGNWVTIWEA